MLDRSSTIQGSQSSRGTRIIGQQKRSQKPSPADDGRGHISVGRRPLPQSTLTTLPTLRRETKRHRAAGGIPRQNLSFAKVRRPSTHSRCKMPPLLRRCPHIKARPTSRLQTLTLLPIRLLVNSRQSPAQAKLQAHPVRKALSYVCVADGLFPSVASVPFTGYTDDGTSSMYHSFQLPSQSPSNSLVVHTTLQSDKDQQLDWYGNEPSTSLGANATSSKREEAGLSQAANPPGM